MQEASLCSTKTLCLVASQARPACCHICKEAGVPMVFIPHLVCNLCITPRPACESRPRAIVHK